MNIKDVPQDNGIIADYGQEICYAVDENGKYILASSIGWDVKNVVNDQAWEILFNDLKTTYDLVVRNILSPLAYHMKKNQMDPCLLGKYVSLSSWKVKRHLKPKIFKNLNDDILANYSEVFNISIDELKTVPDSISIETIKNREK